MTQVVIAMDGVEEAMQNLREAFGDDTERIRRIVLFRVNHLMSQSRCTKYPDNAKRLRHRAQAYLNAIAEC